MRTSSWRGESEVWWHFCRAFVPAALLLGVMIGAIFWHQRRNDLRIHEQAGQHLVRLHGEIIGRELHAVESELAYLAEQAPLRRFAAGDLTVRDELEGEYLRFCSRKAIYDQIRYLGRDGQELIRINYEDGDPHVVEPSSLQSKTTRYYFVKATALPRGDIFVSPLDLNVEHGQVERPYKPVIRFATPVFAHDDQRHGVLVLNLLGQGLLDTLAITATGFPGSAWLLNREGDYLRGPDSSVEWGFIKGTTTKFQDQHADAWPDVQRMQEGQLLCPDGLYTVRTLPPREGSEFDGELQSDLTGLPVGDATLRIVSFVPNHALYAQAYQLLIRLIVLSVAAAIPIGALTWYFARASVIRRQHERQLAESELRLRTLSKRLLTAQEDERRSLSRDLHDELGQLVTAVTLDLERAANPGNDARHKDLVNRALNGTLLILDRIHEISSRVRPPMLDDLGLRDAVRDFISEFSARTGIEVRLELQLDEHDTASELGGAVYRIVQEALTNVARHAEASLVTVGIKRTPHTVDLSIRDDGIGFDTDAPFPDRLGLLGMRERAELLGGQFSIHSVARRGTYIEVSFPVPPTAGTGHGEITA